MNIGLRKKPVIDILFLLALFSVFLMSALFVVLFGANIYKSTVANMDSSFKNRTAVSYVTEKVRQHDESGSVDVMYYDKLTGSIVDTDSIQLDYDRYASASGNTNAEFIDNEKSFRFDFLPEEITSVLKLTENVDGTDYCTYLYEKDGYLCELTSRGDLPFNTAGGQEIVALKSFSISRINDSLYRFFIIDENGRELSYCISVYSYTNGEELVDE